LLETLSFEIQTRDQFNDKIDEVLVGVTVQMARPAEFKRAELVLSSHQNAVRAKYLFKIVATNPLKNGNIIMLTFPKETELPDDDGVYACSSNTIDYISRLACSTVPTQPRTVKMVPTLRRTIPPLETFEIEVNGILNPASTKPAGSVEIIIYSDSSQKDTLNRDSGNLQVQTYIPYTLASSQFSLSRTERGPGLDTICTISFSLKHSLEANSGVIIGYPAEVTADPDKKPLKVKVNAKDYNFESILEKPSRIDYSARQVMFAETRGFTKPLIVEKGKE